MHLAKRPYKHILTFITSLCSYKKIIWQTFEGENIRVFAASRESFLRQNMKNSNVVMNKGYCGKGEKKDFVPGVTLYREDFKTSRT